MRTIAQATFADSTLESTISLPRAGCALENPFVYDAAAREIKALAEQGLVEVVEEQVAETPGSLITHLSFKRLK